MAVHPCPPWESFRRPVYPTHYPSHFTQHPNRGFAVTTSGITSGMSLPSDGAPAPRRSMAPFIVTIIGFVLAFGLTIAIRYHATHPSSLASGAPPANPAAAQAIEADNQAPLFPPAPAVAGVSSATPLAPAAFAPPPPTISPPDPPAAAAAGTKLTHATKHRKSVKKHHRTDGL